MIIAPDLTAIQELAIQRKGWVEYFYFAWIDGKWIDLAPFGNRLP